VKVKVKTIKNRFLCITFSLSEENQQKQEDDLGAQFTDKFVQEPENVTLLLTLLEVSLNCQLYFLYTVLYCLFHIFGCLFLMLFDCFPCCRSLTFMSAGQVLSS